MPTRFVPTRFVGIELRGDSMLPSYNNGDWLLFSLFSPIPNGVQGNMRGAKWRNNLIGKVVLVRRAKTNGSDSVQSDFLQIKRVVRIDSIEKVDGIWVEGDNKEASTDSRSWGSLRDDEIIGKLLFRYRLARK